MARITYTQIDALTKGMDRTMANMVERTCLAVNSVEENLAGKLAYMADTMDRVQRALAAGRYLNSLGEFQRQPAEIDQLIAARSIHWHNLGALIGSDLADALAAGEDVAGMVNAGQLTMGA
jgi:hypothetical protein